MYQINVWPETVSKKSPQEKEKNKKGKKGEEKEKDSKRKILYIPFQPPRIRTEEWNLSWTTNKALEYIGNCSFVGFKSASWVPDDFMELAHWYWAYQSCF